ncbi:LSU ribosomal protein L24p (L26e) [Fructilactobacillus florum 8D]|uniref:Large ribosomal subunit protein uL24 n=2 Tax=Fructilactobacillus florum TaxID=640331 RepID=W9EGU8_9LACO|nr:50S ribosomal protein L24 [Fructilactobacillus florum]EKK20789.1 LSU ribosomal protein L24p (L26e) [Fructilactobacillus florum 2F]ETO40461.1 LSU ribosomal protein L24p (L26e) [Fructilactobacillus florum 8D]KRM91226.1 50S ribosomal protein L24 [Fructilactobacillus florum DSM 22689 = JCM 16035]
MFLKTGDKVRVIAGKDKGKDGTITRTIAAKNRVVVDGINMVKKHQKASQNNPQGNVSDVAAPIDASNVMLLDPSTNKPTRIKVEIKDGKKVRISKKSQKAID